MKSSPTVNLLLTNLRLLDYDNRSPESFPITADVFTSLANKGRAFEHIIHHLLQCYDPEECEIVSRSLMQLFLPLAAATAADSRRRDLKVVGRYTNPCKLVVCGMLCSIGSRSLNGMANSLGCW
jgi:hypothetical protein